jgi:anti-sigma factor (TIGR02949 family)
LKTRKTVHVHAEPGVPAHDARCRWLRKLIYRMLDSPLTPDKRRELRRQIATCPACFSRYEFSMILQRAIRKQVLGEKCPYTLILRVRNALATAMAPRCRG